MLTVERLKEVLDYDPDTGVFTWKPRPAGHLHADSGYVSIMVDGIEYKAHRLAWFLLNQSWPTGVIDHLNGVRCDNRIENLRDATSEINSQNQRRANAKSASKYLGVTFHKKRAKWQASITVKGKRLHLGLYLTPEEARDAYLNAKRVLHEGCTI